MTKFFRDDWTNEETLRLLKGVEALGENWEDIASFVNTRDAQECIKHFINLPIDPSINFDAPHNGTLVFYHH